MVFVLTRVHECCNIDEAAAEREAVKARKEGLKAYAQADVVVALGGWDDNSARPSAEGALRALKYLLEGDKELPGVHSNQHPVLVLITFYRGHNTGMSYY